MYNEIYPCISEPKTKVHVDERSVYQLLSNMRVGKKDNILKLLVTEKTHATLKRKKYFPMFLNHIDFLTKRAGWRVTKVYSHCTFELEPFKKDYILGNQIARQEAVARADDVQANFWKLLNNANFGFDCRNNSQNKRLHLIYMNRPKSNLSINTKDTRVLIASSIMKTLLKMCVRNTQT